MAIVCLFVAEFYSMVRRTAKAKKMPWDDDLKPLQEKYLKKCVVGPKGKLWIGNIFPHYTAAFCCRAFNNDKYDGTPWQISMEEIERDYTLVD
jgi:hypothetical protein